MNIFEIVQPGSWLQGIEDPQEQQDVQALLGLMIDSVHDAALALWLFESAPRPQVFDRGRWRKEADRESMLFDSMRSQIPPGLNAEERWNAEGRIRASARAEARRQRWQAGELPTAYIYQLRVMHAKSFVYALDTFEKALKGLRSGASVTPQVIQGHDEFWAVFPQVLKVRNSAHHADERRQGKQKKVRIEPKPIETGMFQGSTGALINDALGGNRFGTVMEDGHFGEVEISHESVAAAQRIIQSVLDSYKWIGPPVHMPY